ncbi:hypothetical protein [Thiohalomonas denitrificans]|uniref:hypothetical protein n=1 Tax=Thiohalomonas denitrificans TaxID=415747 RepID=UPI0026F108E1|nr:hypothetical protein [Thiohalomonas denitrificans]
MKRLRRPFAALMMVFGLSGLAGTVQAGLSTDLQALNTQATELQTYLQGVTLSADDLCAPLNRANALAGDITRSIETAEGSVAAPLQTDADVYDGLDELFATSQGIANQALRLSVDLQILSTTTAMVTTKDAIAAMLQLSSDIGAMADRIGEMADKILVMSDNIGLMADRILVSQQLQSDNFSLTTDALLQTQANVLTLVSVVEDNTYNPSFANLVTEGGLLATQMEAVVLSPWTMDSQLQSVAAGVHGLLGEVQALHDAITSDTADHTAYISRDALIQLDGLSLMVTPLAAAVEGYAIAISGLQAMTWTPTLKDAVGSTLQLSGDIGTMANSILEMADQILVMADNIGLQADRILLTQEAMNRNVATTQAFTLDAQEMAISLIVARNL